MRIRTETSVRVAAAALLVLRAVPASAQLDPLLFLKTTQHNVLLVVDTSHRMQLDADGEYYDPAQYPATGAIFEPVLGITPLTATARYYRKYLDLRFVNPSGGDKFSTSRIEGVGDRQPGYATFFEHTRLAVARRGLVRAVNDNFSSVRFSLIKMRQSGPAIGAPGNEGPVLVSDLLQQNPTDLAPGKWQITTTTVSATNSSIGGITAPLVAADTANANTTVRDTLNKNLGTAGALIPAGRDDMTTVDAPVDNMLDDARAEAVRLIGADTACRNTVVVLVVGGGEGTITKENLGAKASQFLSVSGRRVPIYVIAIAPPADEVAELEDVAVNSGGQFFEITQAMIDAVSPGAPVPEVVRAVNLAVQHTFASQTDFNTAPTAALPYGPQTDYQVTSPIVGTVNLRDAEDITGASLPLTFITTATGNEIPQRSNVLVTSALALPGFDGRLRAFRVYEPVVDSSKPSGYRFDQDGTRLWVGSVPAEGSRNIYTVLPSGGGMVAFSAANAALLAPYLGAASTADAQALITWIRSQPLGAIVDSTPAFLDPPSLDPPPDDDYPEFREDNKDRRTLVLVGANDGMLHALDARLGVEVFAFIPFNLLPKLRTLPSGQSFDAFKYFVDSSPKVADVKVSGQWRTFLFFGQGPGGTFYNSLDVTLSNLSDSVSPTDDGTSALLSYFSNSTRITWEWSFPRNTSFDHTIAPYGDVAASASSVEKTVGETWSDPAIGQIDSSDGPWEMFVGSGFFPYTRQQQAHRGGVVAGTTFYVLSATTGDVHESHDVGSDPFAENVDNCRAINDCRRLKNALQMDPVATGPSDSRFVNRVYIGDLDGKVWRFSIGIDAGGEGMVSAPTSLYNASSLSPGSSQPLFSSMATVNVGGTQQYIFVGTGSDLLPSNGVSQNYRLLILLDAGATATKTAEILLEATDGAAGDEKVTAFPAVAGDIVFFTTTTYFPTTPCTPYSANLYAFTFIGGPAYDTNGDGSLTAGTGGGKKGGGGSTSDDSVRVFSSAGNRATAPFIVDQHLVFSVGDRVEMFGDPQDFNNGVGQAGVRILSWREVR